MHKAKFYVIFSIFSIFINAKDYVISPGPNAYESLQEAMILMSPGDSILIKSGEYFFEDSLSLDVDNAVIRGEGLNATILNFKNQKSGAQGILVTSNKVVLRDFAVIDANGDIIPAHKTTAPITPASPNVFDIFSPTTFAQRQDSQEILLVKTGKTQACKSLCKSIENQRSGKSPRRT